MTLDRRLSVAPMMDWTDRHCRRFHRTLTRRALLYTEMVTARAVVHGDRDRLLGFAQIERPLALQLGGSEPEVLAEACRIAGGYGYDEINLNVGCPSDRVQSGAFGACLMRDPSLVAHCVEAMIAASDVEVTVKCRLGVDEQEPAEVLPAFVETVASAGVRSFAIHARKAWLEGLSPKENRTIPPLDYGMALSIKRTRPDLEVAVNGGIASLDEALGHLADGFDGAMIGRAAYHEPLAVLAAADRRVFGEDRADADPAEAVREMADYARRQAALGVPVKAITRHMLGLFAGRPGARAWRRHLSENAPKAGPEVLEEALAHVLAPT